VIQFIFGQGELIGRLDLAAKEEVEDLSDEDLLWQLDSLSRTFQSLKEIAQTSYAVAKKRGLDTSHIFDEEER